MESWLKASGATGLDSLELADFPDTGRGVKTLKPFKEGEKILTIPSVVLWTVKHAQADFILGPALLKVQPPLSVEDTLASYILFVRSREAGYDGPRSHIVKFPASYSSSIFFTDDELEVCAGTSLYLLTQQLRKWIANDYESLVTRLFGRHRNLFPAEKTTIEDVGAILHVLYVENQPLTTLFRRPSTSGLSAASGVEPWILSCRMELRFERWHPLQTCSTTRPRLSSAISTTPRPETSLF